VSELDVVLNATLGCFFPFGYTTIPILSTTPRKKTQFHNKHNHQSICTQGGRNLRRSWAPRSRGRGHGRRGGDRGDQPRGRRTPSSGHCRTQGSAQLGDHGTSGRGRVRILYDNCIWRPVLRCGRTYRKPDGDVGIGGITSAASVLLITEGLDDDGVVKCAYDYLFSKPIH
jgi:hypothetical protein